MKAGWEVKTLGDVTQKLETVDPRKQPLEPFTYIDVSSVSKQTLAVSETTKLLGNAAPSRARRMVRTGDTIFATIRPTLKRIAHIGAAHDQAVCSTGYMVLRPISKLEPRFVYYYLQSANFSEAMEGLQKGASYPAVTDAEVRSQTIPLPPLEEQQRIVSILDEAFEGLDRARENAEANLKSARELFGAHLKSIFLNNSLSWETDAATGSAAQEELSAVGAAPNQVSKRNTKTGGRAAAEQHILGNFSLSVKIPYIAARKGWKWSLLTDLARLESGHTPSRRKPEYWGGDISWIGIKDARDRHGLEIVNTLESTNDLGIDNSSARVLPKGTVCLSRTASVGYVTIMGRDMATSQDFVNWVCGPELDPEFLKIIFLAQETEFMKFSSGAVHQTIYFPQAKAFAICHPNVHTQKEIVKQANAVLETTKAAHANCQSKLQDISDLRQSLLQKAFAGELT